MLLGSKLNQHMQKYRLMHLLLVYFLWKESLSKKKKKKISVGTKVVLVNKLNVKLEKKLKARRAGTEIQPSPCFM